MPRINYYSPLSNITGKETFAVDDVNGETKSLTADVLLQDTTIAIRKLTALRPDTDHYTFWIWNTTVDGTAGGVINYNMTSAANPTATETVELEYYLNSSFAKQNKVGTISSGIFILSDMTITQEVEDTAIQLVIAEAQYPQDIGYHSQIIDYSLEPVAVIWYDANGNVVNPFTEPSTINARYDCTICINEVSPTT